MSYLTGQYPHNHGVRSNHPPDGGFEAFDDSESLPRWLDRSGYRTMFIGRYLVGWDVEDPRYVPPGWDGWQGLLFGNNMYEYSLIDEDGDEARYGSRPDDYQTDVFADRADAFVKRRAGRSSPFFLTVWTTAPHVEKQGFIGQPHNPRPAPRHLDRFEGESAPRTPSFDEADVSDKPAGIWALPRLDALAEWKIDNRWRASLESLLAVDDLVERLVERLKRTGELDETLLVFTSDNGYFDGQHRIPNGKNRIYEEAVRVPLLLRGPGIPDGVQRDQLVGNIDLAPTILDAADARAGLSIDGRSLLPLARDPDKGESRDLLIETDDFFAVRTGRRVYSRNAAGEEELYDLEADPFQLESGHADPGMEQARMRLSDRLAELRDCAGDDCR